MSTTAMQDLRPVHGKPLKKNRLPGLLFALGFNFALAFGLYVGLNNATIQLLRDNIKAVVTTEEVKQDLPPPPPPPHVTPTAMHTMVTDVADELSQVAVLLPTMI